MLSFIMYDKEKNYMEICGVITRERLNKKLRMHNWGIVNISVYGREDLTFVQLKRVGKKITCSTRNFGTTNFNDTQVLNFISHS